MILDTSAILAVVFKEPGFDVVLGKVATADAIAIGAPTAAEAAIVLEARLGANGKGTMLRLLDEWQIEVVPFGNEHWKEAAEAYARFGRGRHKAALSFGDCLTYSVAKLADQPLLSVGDDFSKTDLRLA